MSRVCVCGVLISFPCFPSLVDLISVCMAVYIYVCYKWSIFEKPEWLIFEVERGWSIRHQNNG